MLAFRFAARELRSGVRGFYIFLACLAVGVAAIAAAGSTAEAFRHGLATQAREILGGDFAVTVRARPFTSAERAALARIGRVSYAVSAEAMGQAPSGARHLVELRGVGGDYPLVGTVILKGASSLTQALAPRGEAAGAVVEQGVLDDLHLRIGDRFLVGNSPLVARAVLVDEPDRLSRGFALGPRVLTRGEVVERGGFLVPGLPFGETARIAIPPNAPLKAARRAIRVALHAAGPGGWRLRDRTDAAPGLSRLIGELEYFLSFIGLASLVAGGLGVRGAVSAYLEARTGQIATLKAFGAEGRLIRDIYLIQIGFLTVLGVSIGLAIGVDIPLLLGWAIRDIAPVPALFGLYPGPLSKAAAFGLLAGAAFALEPLGRARATAPSALFRGEPSRRLVLGVELTGAILAAGGLVVLALLTAPEWVAAAVMIAAVAVAFVLLWSFGLGAVKAAGRWRGALTGPARIGIANLAGPHSAARVASPAIGLGVALLAAIVLIQSSLLNQIARVAPAKAPALFMTGIPADQAAAFDATLERAFGRPLTPRDYLRAPFATGRIVAVRGLSIERRQIAEDQRWAYDSDISVVALGPAPPDADVIAGHWWARDYSGPPLIALDTEAAKGARVKVGDKVTLSLLGREIETRVAAIRRVDFGGFGASVPLVIDPAALAGAGLDEVATVRATKPEEDRAVVALGRDFPLVTVISVREALAQAASLFGRLELAIRAAAGVAALSGLLVLAGALAAGARARAKEAATLKVLGADRAQILSAYALEYGAVGLIAGVAGMGLGYLAAWPVVVDVFKAAWSVDWLGVASLVFAAAVLAALGGLGAAAIALAQPPARMLRS